MTGGTDESIAEAKKDSAFNMFCEIINNSSCTALYACRSRWRLCQLMRQSAGLDHYIFLSLSIYIYIYLVCAGLGKARSCCHLWEVCGSLCAGLMQSFAACQKHILMCLWFQETLSLPMDVVVDADHKDY